MGTYTDKQRIIAFYGRLPRPEHMVTPVVQACRAVCKLPCHDSSGFLSSSAQRDQGMMPCRLFQAPILQLLRWELNPLRLYLTMIDDTDS